MKPSKNIMQRWFLARFKSESDHSNFLSWLHAWEHDNRYSSEAKIRFVRGDGLFSVWTLHSSDEHYETLFNAVGGFNGVASES